VAVRGVYKFDYPGKERYFYNSSDAQPTYDKLANGDQLLEVDTGRQYLWFEGTWEDDKRLIYAIKEALA